MFKVVVRFYWLAKLKVELDVSSSLDIKFIIINIYTHTNAILIVMVRNNTGLITRWVEFSITPTGREQIYFLTIIIICFFFLHFFKGVYSHLVQLNWCEIHWFTNTCGRTNFTHVYYYVIFIFFFAQSLNMMLLGLSYKSWWRINF